MSIDVLLNKAIWGDRLAKIKDRAENGVKLGSLGLLTNEQKADIQKMLSEGVPNGEVVRLTGVSHKKVSQLSSFPSLGTSKEYLTWSGIKFRCLNPSSPNYKYYGGRGISVCLRWQKSFSDFLTDVGPAPSESHTIERLDTNDGYHPGNVVWATRLDQARNRRFCTVNVLKAKAIRDLAGTGSYTHEQIAELLNVNKSSVAQIIRGESWA